MNTVARVQELAAEHKMSLRSLLQSSGINYSTVWSASKRGGQLSVDTIEQICMALDITLAEFFTEKSTAGT